MRDLLSLLEVRGLLHRVLVPVDPELEIASITARVSRACGPALLFEKVDGHDIPVLTNLFGSRQRMAWALNVPELELLGERLEQDLKMQSRSDAVEALAALVAGEGFAPRPCRGPAPCQEIIEDPPDLERLPALRCWPRDAGRYLTLPVVMTRDPESGQVNSGIYRLQILDARRGALHLKPGSGAGEHHRAWSRRNERTPVAIALGGEAAHIFAAAAPLPVEVEEQRFAGYLRGEGLEMVPCRTCDLQVPASAELIIEGYLSPDETAPEGPFGNHTGYYAPETQSPVLHITAITRRRHPLFPATVVGPPPMEDCFLAKAAERLILPLLRFDFPEIWDINRPLESIFHGCTLVRVHRWGAGSGEELLRSLWQSRWLKGSRSIVLFDDQVDVQDGAACYWRLVNNVDPRRDLIVDQGRIGIDATGSGGREPLAGDPETEALVQKRWRQYGFG